MDKIIKRVSPLRTCLHSISLVFHSLSVFTRSQVPTQFFKEPSINPSRIQHQSERCNRSKLNSGGQGKENSKTKPRKFKDKLKSTKSKKGLNQREWICDKLSPDNEKSTLKDKSNLNNVFRITRGNVKQSAQAKLWWIIQTPTSNTSNNLTQGTLSHNTRIQGKLNSKRKVIDNGLKQS